MQREKKATIKDVAKHSGVAIATVSRVVNGNYPVSEEVRESVWAAIRELDYRPNIAARSLKTRATQTVGVIVADISNMFFMQLVKGIESRLASKGYSIMIAAHYESPAKERAIVKMLTENSVAAIITTTCQPDGSFFAAIEKAGTPVILADRWLPGFDDRCVCEDNLDASRRITQYLIDRGHRRIAVVNGTLTVSTSTLRHKGYLEALRGAGIETNPDYIVDAGNGTAYQATMALLSRLPRDKWPTALFCTNNKRCEDTLHALQALGVSIPGDISVVSYGNIEQAWLSSIRLTHVRQDLMALGEKTADVTIDHLEHRGGLFQYIVASDIVQGNSVKTIL